MKIIDTAKSTPRTSNSKRLTMSLLTFFLTALLLRIFFACTYRGFEADTACFHSWAVMLWENGFSNFYSPEYFCDYPPGYLYVLYILGGLIHLFGMDSLSGGCLLLLKTPAILCDIGAGYLIYGFAKKYFTERTSLILSACYLFHPAVIINSSLWGQVDAVFTLLILAVCILLTEHRPLPAYFLYALGILIKPQVLMFAPLILCALAEYAITHRSVKKILLNLTGGICAIFMLVVLSLPFGLENVFSQYTDTLTSYPYAAVNACNVWGLFGLNWVSQDTLLGLLTYSQIGTFCIIFMTLCSFLLFYRLRKHDDRYYMTGAFLVVSMFLFSVRMHERYMFPAMLLLLFAYIHNRQKDYFWHYWILSIAHFLNVFYVLYYYDPYNYDRKAPAILLISSMTVLGGILFYLSLIHAGRGMNTDSGSIQRSRKTMPIKATDWLIMAAISLFYGLFAFVNLGITNTPVTECAFPYYTYLELEADEDQEISSVYWYLLNEQDITCKLETKKSAEADWAYSQDITFKSVFSWDCITLSEPVVSIRITNMTANTNIGELVLTDAENNPVQIQQTINYPTLFDETNTFPKQLNAQTGSYFDEIYYTRTIYEYMHGLQTYENTHPPMGKVFIMLGAALLGTSPFGFRFMGALFGVLMLPFMYLLGRNITKNRFMGGLTAFLFAFDFMHFAQTRLATIDVFITFFIIVMYYFMEKYCSMSFYDTPLQKTFLPLGACGIAFGFGFASKWTGAYAGAGLAILFFLQLYRRYKEYKYALNAPAEITNGIHHKHVINTFKEYTGKTIGFCCIFFVMIPFIIYLLSYIPFVDNAHSGLIERMAANQISMFNYHSNLTATHPYSSVWYEWPIMRRPIFYYAKNLGKNLRLGISSFGNPLVWWAGIPAFIGILYLAIFKKDNASRFLIIGYLANFLPWTFITRCTFIYHYFPSVPFVVLMLVYCFLQLKRYVSKNCFYVCMIAYAVAAFTLFIMFYPILAGTPITMEYVNTWLKWLDGWVLVL